MRSFEKFILEGVKKKDLSSAEKGEHFLLGAEFEFYHNDHDTSFLQQLLHNAFGSKVSEWEWTDDASLTDPPKFEYTNREVITTPMPWEDFQTIVPTMLQLIDQFGATTDKCGLHVTISYNAPGVDPKKAINFNALARSMDDGQIYKSMPSRQNNKYTRSLSDEFKAFGSATTAFGPTEKYRTARVRIGDRGGMDYGALNNVIEFRAIGGKNYQKKWPEIRKIVLGYMHKLKESLTNPDFMKHKILKSKVTAMADTPWNPQVPDSIQNAPIERMKFGQILAIVNDASDLWKRTGDVETLAKLAQRVAAHLAGKLNSKGSQTVETAQIKNLCSLFASTPSQWTYAIEMVRKATPGLPGPWAQFRTFMPTQMTDPSRKAKLEDELRRKSIASRGLTI